MKPSPSLFPVSFNILPLLEGDWGKANTADDALLTQFILTQNAFLQLSEGHWRAARKQSDINNNIMKLKKVRLSFYLSLIQSVNQTNMDILTLDTKGKPKTGPGVISIAFGGKLDSLGDQLI